MYLVEKILMKVSISLGVIHLLNCFSGLDLILVCGTYPENCPFPLNFTILWSTSPDDHLIFLSVCCYISLFTSDFVNLDMLTLPCG